MRGNPVINFGPCTEPGCTSEQYVRNLCVAHYGRLIRSENSRVLATEFPESTLNRFNAWVGGSNSSGCDPWLGALDDDGYGTMTYRSLSYRAHRIAYELRNGPIPKGYTIDHLCRVKDCVNPDHMEPVTVSENSRRRQADAEPESWCRSGRHELAGDNVIHSLRDGVNRRRCRACTKERDRKRRLKSSSRLEPWSVMSIFNLEGALSATKLAEIFGVSRGAVNQIWNGWTHSAITGRSYSEDRMAEKRESRKPKPFVRQKRHHRLTTEEAMEVISRSSEPADALAEEFNVGTTTIKRIWNYDRDDIRHFAMSEAPDTMNVQREENS